MRELSYYLVFRAEKRGIQPNMIESLFLYVFVFLAMRSPQGENQTEFSLLQSSQKGRWVATWLVGLVFLVRWSTGTWRYVLACRLR